MSGYCQICNEYCLDCQCGKQELPNQLVKTDHTIKMKPFFICIMPQDKLDRMKEEEIRGPDDNI